MYIEKLNRNELDKLNTSSVFNSREWIDISFGKQFCLMGIYNKNRELIGVFYYYIFQRGKVLTQISAPPFSPNCGLWVEDKTINPSQKNTFRKKIMVVVRDYFLAQKFDIFALPFPLEYVDMQEFIWSGFTVEPRYTYQLDLKESTDSLLAKMSSERRKNIKKAEKDGVFVSRATNFEEAKDLIYGSYENKVLEANKTVLNNLFSSFSSDKNTLCFVAYNKDKSPLATVFCVFDAKACYYILGGYNKSQSHEGAGALAMWESIKLAKQMGVEVFDFEGSMLPPIEKYFRGFGGMMIPFYSVKRNKWRGNLFFKMRRK